MRLVHYLPYSVCFLSTFRLYDVVDFVLNVFAPLALTQYSGKFFFLNNLLSEVKFY